MRWGLVDSHMQIKKTIQMETAVLSLHCVIETDTIKSYKQFGTPYSPIYAPQGLGLHCPRRAPLRFDNVVKSHLGYSGKADLAIYCYILDNCG